MEVIESLIHGRWEHERRRRRRRRRQRLEPRAARAASIARGWPSKKARTVVGVAGLAERGGGAHVAFRAPGHTHSDSELSRADAVGRRGPSLPCRARALYLSSCHSDVCSDCSAPARAGMRACHRFLAGTERPLLAHPAPPSAGGCPRAGSARPEPPAIGLLRQLCKLISWDWETRHQFCVRV